MACFHNAMCFDLLNMSKCNFVQVFSENSQILQGLSCKWRLGALKNMLYNIKSLHKSDFFCIFAAFYECKLKP